MYYELMVPHGINVVHFVSGPNRPRKQFAPVLEWSRFNIEMRIVTQLLYYSLFFCCENGYTSLWHEKHLEIAQKGFFSQL